MIISVKFNVEQHANGLTDNCAIKEEYQLRYVMTYDKKCFKHSISMKTRTSFNNEQYSP